VSRRYFAIKFRIRTAEARRHIAKYLWESWGEHDKLPLNTWIYRGGDVAEGIADCVNGGPAGAEYERLEETA
jgi:hypothetical protein